MMWRSLHQHHSRHGLKISLDDRKRIILLLDWLLCPILCLESTI